MFTDEAIFKINNINVQLLAIQANGNWESIEIAPPPTKKTNNSKLWKGGHRLFHAK